MNLSANNATLDVVKQSIARFFDSSDLHHEQNPQNHELDDSRRVFHGRGRCFPGLHWCSIDYFSPMLIVTLFEAPPQGWLDELVMYIKSLMQSLERKKALSGVLVQRRFIPGAPFELVAGDSADECFAKRQSLKFNLSFSQQNIGYFLDIESARCWLEKRANNASILNLFAYTCSFSVVASQAGAASIVNVDLSRRSLDVGRDNHRLNALDIQSVRFLGHDVFKSWGKLRKLGPYDIVIVDPPSYQRGSFVASKDYQRVLRQISRLLNGGGRLLACLNAPEVLLSDFKHMIDDTCGDDLEFEQLLSAHSDFPEAEPERGLKMLVYRKASDSNLVS
ncbi:MAG: methyltransferase [Alteromonadaceae bacterium]|nr:MAG: methyltransferase [Alteromonadaceae bacterium]